MKDACARTIKGLAAGATAYSTTIATYSNGPTDVQNAQDTTSPFAVGTPGVDPHQDVTNCGGVCSTGVEWYPATDLVGGSVTLADRMFKADFE